MNIISLLNQITSHEIVLPATQRDFVWSAPKITKLLDSIMRHGERVSKLLTGEDFSEEVVVPASDLHLASQTFFERMVLESRDGEAS